MLLARLGQPGWNITYISNLGSCHNLSDMLKLQNNYTPEESTERPFSMTTYKDYDLLFNFIIIGDSGVGKSCLLLRFAVSLFPFIYMLVQWEAHILLAGQKIWLSLLTELFKCLINVSNWNYTILNHFNQVHMRQCLNTNSL